MSGSEGIRLSYSEARMIALEIIITGIKHPEFPMGGWEDYPMLTEQSWWMVQDHIDRLGNQLEQQRQEEARSNGIDLVALLNRAEGE